MRAIAEKCTLVKRLHQSGCFVLPNPWGRGSAPARAPWLCGARFNQSGCAWTPGRADYDVENRLAAHIRDPNWRLVS